MKVLLKVQYFKQLNSQPGFKEGYHTFSIHYEIPIDAKFCQSFDSKHLTPHLCP